MSCHFSEHEYNRSLDSIYESDEIIYSNVTLREVRHFKPSRAPLNTIKPYFLRNSQLPHLFDKLYSWFPDWLPSNSIPCNKGDLLFVIGSMIAMLALLCVLIFFLWMWRRKMNKISTDEPNEENSDVETPSTVSSNSNDSEDTYFARESKETLRILHKFAKNSQDLERQRKEELQPIWDSYYAWRAEKLGIPRGRLSVSETINKETFLNPCVLPDSSDEEEEITPESIWIQSSLAIQAQTIGQLDELLSTKPVPSRSTRGQNQLKLGNNEGNDSHRLMDY